MKKNNSKKQGKSSRSSVILSYPGSPEAFFQFLVPYFPADKFLYPAYYELEVYKTKETLPDNLVSILNCIVLPLFDEDDRLKGFVAFPSSDNKLSPEFIEIQFNNGFCMSQSVFGFKQAREAIIETRKVYLTGNYEDAAALYSIGYKNVISIFEVPPSNEQIITLRKYTDIVIVGLDYNKIGEKLYEKTLDEIESMHLVVDEMVFPDNLTPAQIVALDRKEELEEYMHRRENLLLEETFIGNCLVYHEAFKDLNPNFQSFLNFILILMKCSNVGFYVKDYDEIIELIYMGYSKSKFPLHLKKLANDICMKCNLSMKQARKIIAELKEVKDPTKELMERYFLMIQTQYILYMKFRIIKQLDILNSRLCRIGEGEEGESTKKEILVWRKLEDFFNEYFNPAMMQ